MKLHEWKELVNVVKFGTWKEGINVKHGNGKESPNVKLRGGKEPVNVKKPLFLNEINKKVKGKGELLC